MAPSHLRQPRAAAPPRATRGTGAPRLAVLTALTLSTLLCLPLEGACSGASSHGGPGARGSGQGSGFVAGLARSMRSLAAAPSPGYDSSLILVEWKLGVPEAALHIGEGETVHWQWWDDLPHSVEGDGVAAQMFKGTGGGADVVTQKDFVYSYTFDKAGSYSFHCHQHPVVMTGTIDVKPRYNFGGTSILWYDGVSYGGASAIIHVGDTITWNWGDSLGHSLIVVKGDPSIFQGKGTNGNVVESDSFKYVKTFTKPGTFIYKCSVHGTMYGNITVIAKDSSAAPGPAALGLPLSKPTNAKPPVAQSPVASTMLSPTPTPSSDNISYSREPPAEFTIYSTPSDEGILSQPVLPPPPSKAGQTRHFYLHLLSWVVPFLSPFGLCFFYSGK